MSTGNTDNEAPAVESEEMRAANGGRITRGHEPSAAIAPFVKYNPITPAGDPTGLPDLTGIGDAKGHGK